MLNHPMLISARYIKISAQSKLPTLRDPVLIILDFVPPRT